MDNEFNLNRPKAILSARMDCNLARENRAQMGESARRVDTDSDFAEALEKQMKKTLAMQEDTIRLAKVYDNVKDDIPQDFQDTIGSLIGRILDNGESLSKGLVEMSVSFSDNNRIRKEMNA